jgi:hypothetical protein
MSGYGGPNVSVEPVVQINRHTYEVTTSYRSVSL